MSQFRCPVCGFVQGYATLHAHSGRIGDNAGPRVLPPCPNDGAALEPLADDAERGGELLH